MIRDAEVRKQDGGYALFHGDGLLDVFIGLGILLFGAGLLAEMPWLAGIYPAVLLPVWQEMRKSVTIPRLERAGVVAAPHAAQNRRLAMAVIAGILVLSLGVGVSFFMVMGADSSTAQVWLRQHFSAAFGVFLAAIVAAVGGLFRASRYYAYAAAILTAFAASQWLGLSLPLATVIAGVAILLAGLGVLIRFVRQYPAHD